MSPRLAAAIEAARELAWLPTANLPGCLLYSERKESHARLVDRVAVMGALSANASPELRYLVDAMRRVAAASFSNRFGLPYYERREAVAQLRGCLDVYDRELAARAARRAE